MRISLRWLSDYVKADLSPEELAHRLSMAGLEVEAIEKVGSSGTASASAGWSAWKDTPTPTASGWPPSTWATTRRRW